MRWEADSPLWSTNSAAAAALVELGARSVTATPEDDLVNLRRHCSPRLVVPLIAMPPRSPKPRQHSEPRSPKRHARRDYERMIHE